MAVSQAEGPGTWGLQITVEQHCLVSVQILLGGNIFRHIPTGPAHSTSSSSSQASRLTTRSHGLPSMQNGLLKPSTFSTYI